MSVGVDFTNLVGLWRGDSSNVDASGNGNTMTLTGVTYETASPIVGSGSFSLDGIDDSGDVGSNFNYANGFSIGGWVKRSSTGTFDSVFSNWQATNLAGYIFLIWGTDGKLAYFTDSNSWLYSDGNIEDTNLHHVGITIDSSNNVLFYIDGVVSGASQIGVAASTVGTATARMGKQGTANNLYGGLIDELFFFNRVLSGSEFSTIYNGGVPSQMIDITLFNPDPFGLTKSIHTSSINKSILSTRIPKIIKR